MSHPIRYTFILGLVALATFLAAVGGWRYARASAPVNGPIILISIDSLRADHLPIYGYSKVSTPTIDSLAADGIVFERAYSHTPQTLPAHASLLAGRLPFETGVRDNVGFAVKDEERLVAEMLRDRGFETGGIVSSYLLRKESGIGQGFTFFDEEMSAGDPDSSVGGLWRSGDASVKVAEQWLDKADTSRLFLFLHLFQPDTSGQSSADLNDHDAYDAEVAAADATVGHLIRYLKTHQLYDSSTIILVADHGQGLGDHGEHQHGLFVYDEVLRVPLIIKQAAGEGAGRRIAEPVQHIDLVPTILDLAKAPVSGNLSGRSLKTVLEGNGRLEARVIYSESFYGRYHFGWSELTSITDGRYRYIRSPREELYDLELDPNQQENIASTAPGSIIDPLRHDLKQFGAGVAMPHPSKISDEEYELFDAFGFVGSGPDVLPSTPHDPKDKVGLVEAYRAAVQLGVAKQWAAAIDLLRTTLREKPERADVWRRLATYATRLDRHEQAIAAYKRVLGLLPNDPGAALGAAAAHFRLRQLDDARRLALLVVEPGGEASAQEQVEARTLLVEIALAVHDGDTAREEAILAREADSRLPMVDYVEARLLYDSGNLVDSLPIFERAVAESKGPTGGPIRDLHYFFGEALRRLKRDTEAEGAFQEELGHFPQSRRAGVALATLYAKTQRLDDAGRVISEMVRVSPTPETYRLAANLWEAFGDPRQAAAVRAEARRLTDAKPVTRVAQ